MLTRLAGARVVVSIVAATVALGVSAQTPAQRESHPIRLRAAIFTPTRGEQPPVRPDMSIPGYAAQQRGYFIVQFTGPILDDWKTSLAAAGADVLDYVPDFAFKVRMTPDVAARVARLPEVVWVGVFHPAYKLPPDLARDVQSRPYVVRIERGVDRATAETAIAATGARVVRQDGASLTIIADAAQVDAVARVVDVASIENVALRQKHNEFGGGVIMGGSAVNAAGFDGSTQTLAISDTGLGNGVAAGAHVDIPASRITAIFSWPGAPNSCFESIADDGALDVDSGHGTHVATTALGSGGAGGVGRGTAPGAHLIFQALENWAEPSLLCSLLYGIAPGYYLVGIPADVGELFEQAYGAGARLHSNSWGSESSGAYTVDSVNADAFVWAHPDLTVTFSAGNSGTDSNADGEVDPTSINAPATAKNVISVGASENDRQSHYDCDTTLTYTQCGPQGGQNNLFTYATFAGRYPVNPIRDDPSAGNVEQMAAFSSRGPTQDGRIKPDVVAPGTWVLSGYSDQFQQQYDPSPNPQSSLYQYGGWGYPLSTAHKYMGGTSMAAPLVAGGAAVVRDYYQKARAHSASAALVKATLVNSAVDLLDENNDGVNDNAYPIPNVHEGWGRVDLIKATRQSRQFVDDASGLSTSGSATYALTVESAARPLKVTLAWSDYPSTSTAARTLVNDLDLRVVSPDGTTYLGNVFAAGWSTTGGGADRVNNLENVYVQSPAAGTWTIVVSGYNVPNGPQPFATVVDGKFVGSNPNLPAISIVATANATESGPTTGSFRITRGGDTSEPLAATYLVSGTATAGDDYVALTGVVTIPAGSAEAMLLVEPIDDVSIEPDEMVMVTLLAGAAYELDSPASASVTITNDDRPSDLIIVSVSAPTSGAAGATITVTDTTKNQATSSSPVSQTGFYLSANTVLDPQDVLLGNREVSSLTAGAAESQATALEIPVATTPGTYYVIAKADWNNAVAETQEGNNTRSSGAIQIGPDLTVTAVSAPATAAPGSVVTVSDTTKNEGGDSTSASITAFYLSTNFTWEATDVRLGSRLLPVLAPGASHTTSTSVTISASTAPGTYYILARADDEGSIVEIREYNNLKFTSQLRVGADLAITALTAPASAGAGASVLVSNTVSNQGAAEAAPSTTAFYLSVNSVLETADVLLGSRPVSSLAPGATNTQSTTLQIPATTAAGTYYVIAKADSDNAVPETLESNNTRSSGAIAVGPDLTVVAVAAPATAAPGSVVSLSDTTKNEGADSASASLTAFYLSTNFAWDAADLRLGSRLVPVLAPGASHIAATLLTIPATTAPGSYYVLARADDEGGVAESRETNNLKFTSQVKIGADLAISAITAPALAAAGASIAVSDTTTNQGGAEAGTSTTAFYLSLNSIFDASDVRLGARVVPLLGPGALNQGSMTVTVPASTSGGTYFVIAKADDASAVAETNESNNTRPSAAVKVGPDLTVISVRAPAMTGAGSSMTVTDTVSNIGAVASVSTDAILYLSTNTIIDAADVVLQRRTVPPLAGGAADSASVTAVIPTGIAPGNYYVIEQVDAANLTTEAVENNNTGLSGLIRIGPDLTVSALSGPASVVAGTSVTFNQTTANSGGGTAGTSMTSLYLSTNPTLDPADVMLGSESVASLAANTSQSTTSSLAFPPALPAGTYYVLVKADDAGAIAETYETNNTRWLTIKVTAP